MAVLATPPFLQFFNADGDPLAGGKVYTYAAGTTTPKATFTAQDGVTQNTNPVILNAAGIPTPGGSIWLNGAYKFVVRDVNDVLVATTDNVTAFTATPASSDAYWQSFSGTGAQTAFVLSEALGTDEKTIMVFVDAGGDKGFDIQAPSAYTLNGSTLTFAVAPASGTNNIQVWAPARLANAAATSAEAADSSATLALNAQNAAGASESNAATSAATATTAAGNAALFADVAEDWATYPENSPVPGGGGEFSSKHYAAKAEAFAAQAGASASGFQSGTTGGTASAYTVTFGAPVAYTTGVAIRVNFNQANNDNCTLNVNSMGAKKILDGARQLFKGEIAASDVLFMIYSSVADGGNGAWLVQSGLRTVLCEYAIPGSMANGDLASVLEDYLRDVETLLRVEAVLSAGSLTLNFKYNATAVTGGQIAVTTTLAGATPSAANTGAVGDMFTGVISAVSSAVYLTIWVWKRV